MAEDPAKSHIATRELNVCVADPSEVNVKRLLSFESYRAGKIFSEPDRRSITVASAHGCFVLWNRVIKHVVGSSEIENLVANSTSLQTR